ncbi:hypothetical protein Pint_20834 [Pistacia integerrima]|uniref:Uncharacterized protein n=1 Tax=Pistacia integerrima TaxID=434235 RepID=A0ACC0X9J7_9ROSI|nr:hypothetical protein Pint_20834 [Pistacia integerrima]
MRHCCQVKDYKSCSSSQQSKEYRHVSLLCKDVEQPALSIVDNSQKLRTLLLPSEFLKNFGQALETIFHKLKYLRLLDLSSSTIQVLPSSIEELKLLRYLDLSRTEIKVLPDSICNLYNLKTLKLLGCLWLTQLPKDLGNLVNLQNLELDDMFWFKSSTLPPRIGKLTRLQNLHAFPIGCKSGNRIEELKEMAYLTGTLHISKLENAENAEEAKLNEKESVHKLVLEWSNRDANPHDLSDEERLLADLKPHSALKELQIFNYLGNSFPHWMTNGQLRNLVGISLKGCSNCRILSLGELPHLNELYIKGMLELEKWENGDYNSLCRLKISNCPKLRELPKFIPNLRVMKIKKCSSLKALPVTAILMFLILVDNPVLENWNETLLRVISINDRRQQVVQQRLSFISLLEMKVIRLPQAPGPADKLCSSETGDKWVSVIQHPSYPRDEPTSSAFSFEWPDLPGLKALYIRDCKDLVALSGEGSMRSLTSLKLLSIQGCSKLVKFQDEELPPALECLLIGSCSSLLSLGTFGTLKSLHSLKDLYIEDCPLLQSFPEDGLPNSLQHLLIQNCPLLTKQCGNEDEQGPEWEKISHIPDLEIDFIKAPPLPKEKNKAWYRVFIRGGGLKGNEAAESSASA